MEIITIEKSELLRLIDETVTHAVERALSPPEEIMTRAEVRSYLKRSDSTLTRMIRRGLPHRNNRFRRSEVDAWLGVNI